MSDNLTNEIKRPLFTDGSITVTTTGGDITPTLTQPAQSSGQEKYNLDQRDQLDILLYAVTGTVVAGATLTAKYYNRVPNAISDAILLATETKTLAAITVGNYLATEFTDAALELADYFTVECVLKQAVGSSYTVTANVIVKKKNNVAYQDEDVSFDDVTANSLKLNGATSGQSVLQAPATGGVTSVLPSIAGTLVSQPLTGQTAPTTTTVGYLGQTIVTTGGVHYQCMAESGGVYTWLQKYPKPVSIFKLSTDQTTGNGGAAIAAGDRIKFNTTIINDIAGCVIDIATNIGSITLPVGKYQLYWGMKSAFSANTGSVLGTIYETGGAALSAFTSGKFTLTFSSSNTGDYPPAPAYLNLAAETDIEVQLTSAAQVTTIQASVTHIIIERIG